MALIESAVETGSGARVEHVQGRRRRRDGGETCFSEANRHPRLPKLW